MKFPFVVIAFLAPFSLHATDPQPFNPRPFELTEPRPLPSGKPAFLGWPIPDLATPVARTSLISAKVQKYVAVAIYANQAQIVTEDGRRASNLLHDNKIEFVFGETNADAVMLAVSPNQASEARRVLATAIKAEHLKLTLVQMSPKGDWGAAITPDAVLNPEQKP